MKRLLILLPALLLTAACGQDTPDNDPAQITSRSAEWNAALNARDIDGIVSLYTADARILAPNTELAVGHGAIRENFGGMIDAGLSVQLTSIDAGVSGDLGYHVGRYVLSSGSRQVDVGKFMETWQRGDDGLWRISNDIYNSDRPATDQNTHLVIIHEVDDGKRWMAAWRGADSRHKLFADNGAPHVHTFQSVDNPHLTGLVISVSDMAALQDMLESDEGIAAAKQDGVRLDTMKILFETQ